MTNVKLKTGMAETTLTKALWHKGIRYRKKYKTLPGSSDIAITKYKIAIFADGKFCHGENWEEEGLKEFDKCHSITLETVS